MNTPAHVVLNLALLRSRDVEKQRLCFWAVMVGALLPDLPMFYFFVVEVFFNQQPQSVIWNELYFESHWQNFFDLFNSIPLILLVGVIAWIYKNTFAVFVCASMLLHVAFDLPLHHDDGHHHFYPFLSWRFDSPLSYWDPNHYGRIIGALEGLMTVVCCGVLFYRSSTLIARIVTSMMGLLYSAGFIAAASGAFF